MVLSGIRTYSSYDQAMEAWRDDMWELRNSHKESDEDEDENKDSEEE